MNSSSSKSYKKEIQKLQLKMLTIQQGIWHQKKRVIVVFEGFDASGKGGAIRRLTQVLDPRGVRVYPIGPPTEMEQKTHWLYRFWARLPEPGMMAFFDRSWYGRVLVERVENLTAKKDWKRGYSEINQFEKMLVDDGIELIKIYLSISKKEQLKRFEDRLKNPYKQWKITQDDIRSRHKWNDYVKAVEEMLIETNTKSSPWNVIPADNKPFARKEALRIVTSQLKPTEIWMKNQIELIGKRSLSEALKLLGSKTSDL